MTNQLTNQPPHTSTTWADRCRSAARRSRQSAAWRRLGAILGICAAVIAPGAAGAAPIPTPEKLLPEDTLVLVTAPDYSQLREVLRKLPQHQLWNDPAMKAFREKLMTKLSEEMLNPLERDLGIKFADYTNLLQGQLTLAITRNDWQGEAGQEPAVLVLMDARDKSAQLKKNLTELRKKWVDSGRTVKTEKIRDTEFQVLTVASNDVPRTLRKFFPAEAEVQELGDDKTPAATDKDPRKNELYIGQAESLLILGNARPAVEKVLARLGGGSVPPLADYAAYQTMQLTLFREAPVYGWVNVKTFMDVLLSKAAEKKENPDAPNPFDIKPEKIFTSLGLKGLKTVGFAFQNAADGSTLQLSVGVPESERQGLFKLLAGETKEFTPPAFVPQDAAKFQRWRLDGQKVWANLEKMVGDISPQWLAGINFLIDTANTAAKEKDPGFDLRKNLIGNLGDDMISFEKAPRGKETSDLLAPPAIFLLGSPKADQLAASLQSVFVFLSRDAGTAPEEREFLGRKVYTVPMRALPLPMGGMPGSSVPRSLSYAASGGYVAFSTDVAMLEEYLRSADGQGKTLRDLPGFGEALQKVASPGCSLFGFENQAETARASFEILRQASSASTNSPGSAAANPAAAMLGMAFGDQGIKEWFDFSLLPNFDQVSKYFHFAVYGAAMNNEGWVFKFYAPMPPSLRNTNAQKP